MEMFGVYKNAVTLSILTHMYYYDVSNTPCSQDGQVVHRHVRTGRNAISCLFFNTSTITILLVLTITS